MSEEQTKTAESTEAAPVENPDQVTISKAELEALRDKGKVVDDHEAEATSMGFTNDSEYRQFLAEKKLDELEKAEAVTAATPAPKPTETVDPPPAQPALSAEQLEAMNRSERMATNAYLEAQWNGFQMAQAELPDDQRSSLTRSQLFNAVQGPKQALVKQLIKDPEYKDNFFLAADALLSAPKTKADLVEAAKTSSDALKKAEETANVDTSSIAPKPGVGEKTENQKLADEIAPDDAPYEMST